SLAFGNLGLRLVHGSPRTGRPGEVRPGTPRRPRGWPAFDAPPGQRVAVPAPVAAVLQYGTFGVGERQRPVGFRVALLEHLWLGDFSGFRGGRAGNVARSEE